MREIALHILDIARNSVEAGATDVQLTIAEEDEGRLVLTLRDNGRGMTDEQVVGAADPFYTTRTTRRVGLGLSLLKAACERAGGDMTICSWPGEGTEIRCRMQLEHIDRPPLGDMGKVVQALALEANQMNLRYCHKANGRTFEIDTLDLQKELGDVPITDPRVLTWLAEHVKNGIISVGSRA